MPNPPLPPPSPALFLLIVFSLLVLAAIVAAWAWAIVRWALGKRLLPDAKPKVIPWGFFSVVALIVVWFAIQMVLVMAMKRGQAFDLSDADKIVLVGLLNLGILGLVPWLLRWTSGARLSDLGLPGRPIALNVFRGAHLGLMLAPCVYLLMFVITRVWKPAQHPAALSIFRDTSALNVVLMFASAVLLAPAAEELLFRGVLLGWLTRLFDPSARPARWPPDEVLDWTGDAVGPMGATPEEGSPWDAPRTELTPAPEPPSPARSARADWLANVLTSLVFAALHAEQWPAPVPLFVLSMALGILYRRTGSLVAPIALHALFNGLSTTAVLLAALAGIKPPADEGLPPVPPPVKKLAEPTKVALSVSEPDIRIFYP